jgi:hypothetical protein
MAKRSKGRRVSKVVNELDAILRLQRAYADAQIRGGNVPSEIMAKLVQMQALSTKAQKARGRAKDMLLKQADDLAVEIMPYFHFKVGDVSWNKNSSHQRGLPTVRAGCA